MNGFLFVGNHPALDFLNTRPVLDGEPVELLPDFAALVEWFRAARLLDSGAAAVARKRWGQSARARRLVKTVRELRERLRSEILNWESGGAIRASTIEELNRLMEERPMLSRVTAAGSNLSLESFCSPRAPEDLLAPLAYHAAELFAHADRARIRKCGHCVLHFYDTSKKGTRRWCSMQLCGNRLKVAAYAARHLRRSGRTAKET
jgi:predicted RNA-binding Zn ribbon-like protein